MEYDVIIIGAGVIGCSIARALSRYELKVAVLEQGYDVALGSSRANSGIVHAGFDAAPGSKKALFNVRGNAMFDRLAQELEFPFSRCGSLVLAFSEEDIEKLFALKEQGEENDVEGLRVILREELLSLEPNIGDEAVAALYAPTGGIVCPYEMTIALFENAVQNGVEFHFAHKVTGLVRQADGFKVTTGAGEFHGRYVINAAGLFADELHNMLCKPEVKILPRKGEYCLLDKMKLVTHTIFQLPTAMGKGILVTPTVSGNVLLGPTATDILDKADTDTTAEGLSQVLQKAALSVKGLPTDKVIANFSGLRANLLGQKDFFISLTDGCIQLVGIESPGLTSAPAIGEHAAEMVLELTACKERADFTPYRTKIPCFREMSDDEKNACIRRDSAYGEVICRCEQVTKGEILEAIRRCPPTVTLDAVKRRTRTGMGRCQGSFCAMRMVRLIAKACGIPVTDVTKYGGNSHIFTGLTKEGASC